MRRFYIAIATSVLVLLIQWTRYIQCNNYTTYLNGTNGNIYSPGYPNSSYPSNSVFRWIITVGKDQYIKLEIKDFILQGCHHDTCEYCDFVEISYDTSFRTFCARTPPPRFTSTEGSTMNITFHTDNRLFGSRGFWFYYEARHTMQYTCPPSPPRPNNRIPAHVILVATIGGVVALVFLVLLCCGLKTCLCDQQQNHPEDHPSSFTAPRDLSNEDFQRRVGPPPSYEEAATSSQTNIDITLPSLDANGEGPIDDVGVYDSTGLPSYNEAMKTSQISLSRV